MSRKIELAGALALVTGAGSGIGKATALALAGQGARVVAVDIDGDTAEKTAVACDEAGAPETGAFACDVADASAVQALADQVHERWHPLDVLVNNAGVGMTGRFGDMSLDDWRWIRGVNLDGVVHGCHTFGPAMVERGRGHVVNVSSGLSYIPRATEPGYCTTKAAVLALSQCLRADWAPKGVGVSVVCPGLINTPIIDRTRFLGSEDNADTRSRVTEMFRKRGHKPEVVAKAILQAVERDRIMVAPGVESKIGWVMHRLLPLSVQQVTARVKI